jgi:hypothetical protein
MPIMQTRLKLLSVLIITAILCAGCEIPDLTEFTQQSAEMTRGIRSGVKDTESVIKTASERKDLFSDVDRKRFSKDLNTYRAALKPTVETLDALDAYLDALNALSQANKKSAENSKAVVDSVTGLVTAVSGLTFGAPANIASGLLTLVEQFRTTRNFKKRVNLAAQIVEGGFNEVTVNGDKVLVKACTGNAEAQITQKAGEIADLMNAVISGLSKEQQKEFEPLSLKEKRQKLIEAGRFNEGQLKTISAAETTINSFQCGVIDLLKFNVRDLIKINHDVSRLMVDNARQKYQTVFDYHEAILKTDEPIQHELQIMLSYKNVGASIRELEATDGKATDIFDQKVFLKTHLNQLAVLDAQLPGDIDSALHDDQNTCVNMQKFVKFKLCADCEKGLKKIVDDGLPKSEFDRCNGRIEKVMEERATTLYEQNKMYLDELNRIAPGYSLAVSDVEALSKKQKQLDQLLGASLSALDAWANSHANLRVAVNTNKPLSVGQLAAKVREIFSIINPPEKS